MYLSMWIFADWLKEYQPVVRIRDNSMTIDTIRLLSRHTAINDHTLYIGLTKDFFDSRDNQIFCVHRNDILLLPEDDLGEIMNKLLEAMEFFSRWNAEILEMISNGCMIEDILRHSDPLLKEPVFILDSGQKLLAISSNYAKGEVDLYYDELMEYGSTNLDFIMNFNQNYARGLFRKHGIYLVDENIIPHKAYCYNFFLKGTWIGVTNLLVMNESVSQGTLDLFLLFCQYIDLWFDSHSQQQTLLFLDSLFHFALSGQECDYDYFNHHLHFLGWEEHDTKALLTLTNVSDTYNIHAHLCRTVNDQYPYAYAIVHNNYICVLCNLRQKKLSAVLQDLSPWLKKGSYYGCCSSVFQNLEFLDEYFEQTRITARFCPGKPGQIYHFQDYMVRYGLSIINRQIRTSLIHPAVKKLEEYDEKNHTDFGRTLYLYIQQERSQSHTADALNIHRNTLTYRLGRLKELISCNLDDPEVRLHLLISYELLHLSEQESASG